MTIFKTFLKVLMKNKWIIIMYTGILIFFTAFQMQTSENNLSFTSAKPDIMIINHDEEKGITKDLINYLAKNCKIKDIKESSAKDALFYRDVNYIVEIPVNFREDFLQGVNPKVKTQTTKDYNAHLAEQMLERYLKIATIYQKNGQSEEEIIENLQKTLAVDTKVKLTSHVNSSKLSKVALYYNFTNYSILAGCVYVICLILSSFKEEKIRKRTIISSTSEAKYNRQLLLSNSLFALILWGFYVLLSIVLLGDVMLTSIGLLFVLNSFIFTLCGLTLAFLIGVLVTDKNALNGIINCLALGTSFLCGAFVPLEWLPNFVLTIAHILPSYYYIYSNELIKELEEISLVSLQPILLNMGIILVFAMAFSLLAHIITKHKRKFG